MDRVKNSTLNGDFRRVYKLDFLVWEKVTSVGRDQIEFRWKLENFLNLFFTWNYNTIRVLYG